MQQHFTDKDGRQIVAPGPFRIVDSPNEFADLTRQGWGLVFTYQDQAVVNVMKFVRAETSPGPSYPVHDWDENGKMVSVPPGHKVIYEQAVVQRQRFVLKQDVESALRAAAERVAVWEAAATERGEAVRAAEQEIAKLRADHGEQGRALATKEEALEKALNECSTLRSRAQKLEQAIGVLRKELGAARMRDLLGE